MEKKDKLIERAGSRVHSLEFLWSTTPQKDIDYSEETNFELLLRAKKWLPIHWVAKQYGVINNTHRRYTKHDEERTKCFIHGGNNPSSLVLWKGINAFKCWACGASGDVIDFVQELEETPHIPYDTIRHLLEKYNGRDTDKQQHLRQD